MNYRSRYRAEVVDWSERSTSTRAVSLVAILILAVVAILVAS